MYSKIALKNVKKSFKDYGIYFLTLTLAVCIFYAFNSIDSQKAMIEASMSDKNYMKSFTSLISYMSVFVAFILGGLILYANNFLIKRRNKELGIYMTLGMSKNNISTILVLETLIVGIFSLISGLIVGAIASQGLSVMISKIFAFEMTGYTFSISLEAMKKTVLYFGVMFILVMIFNTFVISKYKIIDLLTVGRKTEEVKFKNPIIYVVTFVLCVVSLGLAYKIILSNGIGGDTLKIIISIILGILGTVLFFFSLSGFILFIVKSNKNIYFHKLNIFTVKQINSKVNTNFLSMSIICLMLFMTTVVLSTGFTFKESLESQLKKNTPFDVTASLLINPVDKVQDIKESFKNMGIKLGENDKVACYNEYIGKTNLLDFIKLNDKDAMFYDGPVIYTKISDYNEVRTLKGEKPVSLKDNEVLVVSNSTKILPLLQDYMKSNNTMKLEGKDYTVKNKDIIEESLKTDSIDNTLTVIVNDDFCNDKTLSSSNIDINFEGNNKIERENKLFSTIKSKRESGNDEIGYIMFNSKSEIFEANRGMSTKALFIGIYIGMVFLISSMAVLALQQLSEANESIDRYASLKKLGVNMKSINKTIFTQTLVYFSLPLILAFIHSAIGIKVANSFVLMYNKADISGSSLMTAGIFMFIYAIYFYITYSGYKNIVKNSME